MKYIFLLSLLFFYSNLMMAQAPLVKISDKIKLERKEAITGFLKQTDKGYFVKAAEYNIGMFSVKTNMFLQEYNKKFELVKSYDYESKNKNVQNIDIIELKNVMYLLSENKDSKNDFISYSFTDINQNGKLGTNKGIAKFKFERKKDIPTTSIIRSQDSTTLSFMAYVDTDDNKDLHSCFVSVFDDKMNERWNRKVSLKKPQEVIQVISSAVNNEGKVYILYKEYEGKKAKESKKNKPAYDLVLAIISDDKSPIIYKTIDIKSFFVTNATIKVMPDGNIGMFGLSSPTKRGYTNGIFNFKIDQKTDSIFNVSQKEFSAEDLEMLDEEDNTKKDKGEEGLDSNIELIDISYLKDGSSYVTMEENYTYTVSSYNGRTWTTTTYYVSNDIVVIKVDPAGKIDYLTTIPKRQRFTFDSYNSCVIIANEDGYNAIYNDDEDNLKKEQGKRKRYISSLKECVAVMTNIDNKGKKTRYELFNSDDTRAILLPSKSKKLNSNQVFFVAEKGASLFSSSDRRVGTISLK